MKTLILVAGLIPAVGSAQGPRITPQASGTSVRLQAVSVVNDRVAWASGVRGIYLKTVDGGATWAAATVPGADSLEFRDVQGFDASNALLLAAGPGDKSRVYRTTDGGATWTMVFRNTVPEAFYDCLAFSSSTHGYAMADAIGREFPMIETTDGGQTWHRYQEPTFAGIAEPGEGGFAASGTCIAARGTNLWIGTAKGGRVLARVNGRWRAATTPIVHTNATAGVFSVAFRSPLIGVAVGGDLEAADRFTDNVATTRDGGATWTLGGRVTFSGPVYGVGYARQGAHPVLVATGPNGSSWSADGGMTWQALDTGGMWGLDFTPSGTGWLVGPGGRVVKVEVREGGSRK